MAKSRLAYAGLLLALIAAPAFAETVAPTPTPTAAPTAAAVATDAAQQQKIEAGLKSGQLTTKEAAGLEKSEAKIDQAQSKSLKDGVMTPQESARINEMQTNEDKRINKAETNATTGNPNSVSSKRMQEDVQQNASQEKRIENGVVNGTMTNKEASRMEKGEAKVDRKEARAGRNGHIGRHEQAGIEKSAKHQSGRIYHAKHNTPVAPGTAAPAAVSTPAPASTIAQ